FVFQVLMPVALPGMASDADQPHHRASVLLLHHDEGGAMLDIAGHDLHPLPANAADCDQAECHQVGCDEECQHCTGSALAASALGPPIIAPTAGVAPLSAAFSTRTPDHSLRPPIYA